MTPKLPTFFKLPSYNEFNYIPRYYDKEKADREARRKKLKFRSKLQATNPEITDQIHRSKLDSARGMRMISTLIRIALIVLFVIVALLIARSFGLLWLSSS